MSERDFRNEGANALKGGKFDYCRAMGEKLANKEPEVTNDHLAQVIDIIDYKRKEDKAIQEITRELNREFDGRVADRLSEERRDFQQENSPITDDKEWIQGMKSQQPSEEVKDIKESKKGFYEKKILPLAASVVIGLGVWFGGGGGNEVHAESVVAGEMINNNDAAGRINKTIKGLGINAEIKDFCTTNDVEKSLKYLAGGEFVDDPMKAGVLPLNVNGKTFIFGTENLCNTINKISLSKNCPKTAEQLKLACLAEMGISSKKLFSGLLDKEVVFVQDRNNYYVFSDKKDGQFPPMQIVDKLTPDGIRQPFVYKGGYYRFDNFAQICFDMGTNQVCLTDGYKETHLFDPITRKFTEMREYKVLCENKTEFCVKSLRDAFSDAFVGDDKAEVKNPMGLDENEIKDFEKTGQSKNSDGSDKYKTFHIFTDKNGNCLGIWAQKGELGLRQLYLDSFDKTFNRISEIAPGAIDLITYRYGLNCIINRLSNKSIFVGLASGVGATYFHMKCGGVMPYNQDFQKDWENKQIPYKDKIDGLFPGLETIPLLEARALFADMHTAEPMAYDQFFWHSQWDKYLWMKDFYEKKVDKQKMTRAEKDMWESDIESARINGERFSSMQPAK